MADTEAQLIQLAGLIRNSDFNTELQALIGDFRTRCLKWLLAQEEYNEAQAAAKIAPAPAPAAPVK